MRKLIANARFLADEDDDEDDDPEIALSSDDDSQQSMSSSSSDKSLKTIMEEDAAVQTEEALRAIINNPDYRPRFPVVYRYYGRNQALPHSSGSIPFLLLGPNVDHWKVTGQELSNRGYNVVACERVINDNGSAGSVEQHATAAQQQQHQQQQPSSRPLHYTMRRRESALLILQLLDALRWNKVVLVACDNETLLAVEAAMQLAPHRVAGVVLCGRLAPMADLVPEATAEGRDAGSVDQYLKDNLRCPFTIVWDGAIPPLPHGAAAASSSFSAAGETVESCSTHRCLILGGGSAPHRRRPELMAWALTRFVEKQIMPSPNTQAPERQRRVESDIKKSNMKRDHRHLPFRWDELVSPGTLLVVGRVVAKALFYGVLLKSVIYQYDNVRWGIFNVKSKIELIASLPLRFVKFSKVLVTFVPRNIGRLSMGAVAKVKLIPKGMSSGFAGVIGACKSFAHACMRDVRVEDATADDAEREKDEIAVEKTDASKKTDVEKHSQKTDDEGDGDDEKGESDNKKPVDEQEKPKRPPRPSFILDQVIV